MVQIKNVRSQKYSNDYFTNVIIQKVIKTKIC